MVAFFACCNLSSVAGEFGLYNVVGKYVYGSAGDGGQATASQMGDPFGVWMSPLGEMYIGQEVIKVIRKVGTDGIISRFAGTTTTTVSGNGGKATSADMAVINMCGDSSNLNIYVVQFANQMVRRVSLSDNIINAFAGAGSVQGDGGPATSALLASPLFCVVDPVGDVYISQQTGFIRKVQANSGIITTVAGTSGSSAYVTGLPATSTPLPYPYQMFLDANSNLFVRSQTVYLLRKIDMAASNVVVTIAGRHWFISLEIILLIHQIYILFRSLQSGRVDG